MKEVWKIQLMLPCPSWIHKQLPSPSKEFLHSRVELVWLSQRKQISKYVFKDGRLIILRSHTQR